MEYILVKVIVFGLYDKDEEWKTWVTWCTIQVRERTTQAVLALPHKDRSPGPSGTVAKGAAESLRESVTSEAGQAVTGQQVLCAAAAASRSHSRSVFTSGLYSP